MYSLFQCPKHNRHGSLRLKKKIKSVQNFFEKPFILKQGFERKRLKTLKPLKFCLILGCKPRLGCEKKFRFEARLLVSSQNFECFDCPLTSIKNLIPKFFEYSFLYLPTCRLNRLFTLMKANCLRVRFGTFEFEIAAYVLMNVMYCTFFKYQNLNYSRQSNSNFKTLFFFAKLITSEI